MTQDILTNRETLDRATKEIKASGAADADARVARLEEAFKTQQAANEQAKKSRLEAAEANLRGDLKRAYFTENPNATDEDFEKDYPSMRSERMRRLAANSESRARADARRAYRE